MGIKAKLYNFLKKTIKEDFMEATLTDGKLVNIEPALEVGAEAYLVAEDGLEPLEDGEYTTDGGIGFVVVNGLVSEVIEATEEEMSKVAKFNQIREVEKFMEAVLTDGTVVSIEPELAEGAAVNVLTDTGLVPAPDGEHQLEDGTIITVSGGVITAIGTAEEVVEEEAPAQEMEQEVRNPKVVIERTEIESKFEEATSKVAELESQLAEALATIETMKAEAVTNEERFAELAKMMEEFSAQPKEEPVVKTTAKIATMLDDESLMDRVQRFKKVMKIK